MGVRRGPRSDARHGHAWGQAPGEAVLCCWSRSSMLHARARRTAALRRDHGYAATHDAHHHQDPAPDAQQYARAMQRALDDAGSRHPTTSTWSSPTALAPRSGRSRSGCAHHGVRFTDGAGAGHRTATDSSDDSTPADPRSALRPRCWRCATASSSGRQLDEPIPTHGLDLVTETRELPVETVLVNARGFGGFNSCMVLQRYREE